MTTIHTHGDNLSIDWKIQQLTTIQRMLTTEQEVICHALYQDLQKSSTEALAMEIRPLQAEISYFLKHLRKQQRRRWWTRKHSHSSLFTKHIPSPLLLSPIRSKLESYPLAPPGVLVIGPCNYPFALTVRPAIGSLAAGNPTVLKPNSQACPHTSQLLERLVSKYFPTPSDNVKETDNTSPPALQVWCSPPEDAIEDTQALMNVGWGTVFFTGSANVGKLIAQAAARTLTPTILELGGKCPTYVDDSFVTRNGTTTPSLRQVADRIVWSKLVNAGQTCVAPDYVLVHTAAAKALQEELPKAVARQYGLLPKQQQYQSNLGRIVTTNATQRLFNLLHNVQDEILQAHQQPLVSPAEDIYTPRVLMGGLEDSDLKDRFVAPTILWEPPMTCRLWEEEIFGPILPVKVVENHKEAIQWIQRISPAHPLALYVFTKHAQVFDSIRQAIPSGAAVRNDCVIHLANHHSPFGGLGVSGYGRYHGKYSLDSFTHVRPVVYRVCTPGADFGMTRFEPMHNTLQHQIVTEGLVRLPYIPVLPIKCLVNITVPLLLGLLLIKKVPFLRKLVLMFLTNAL